MFNSVELADLDLDGDLDIATTYSSSLKLFLNNGSGAFTQQLVPSSTSVASIAITDLDGDGDFDIATGDTSSFAPGFVLVRESRSTSFFREVSGKRFSMAGLRDRWMLLTSIPMGTWMSQQSMEVAIYFGIAMSP